ncbi:hypothetical protein AAVH_24909, partial [Aphelenchoides avenae]
SAETQPRADTHAPVVIDPTLPQADAALSTQPAACVPPQPHPDPPVGERTGRAHTWRTAGQWPLAQEDPSGGAGELSPPTAQISRTEGTLPQQQTAYVPPQPHPDPPVGVHTGTACTQQDTRALSNEHPAGGAGESSPPLT